MLNAYIIGRERIAARKFKSLVCVAARNSSLDARRGMSSRYPHRLVIGDYGTAKTWVVIQKK